MSTAKPSQSPSSRRGRRVASVAIVGVIAAILITGVAVWFVFFSSDAPDAPTIEGAAAVLQGSAAPQTTGDATAGSPIARAAATADSAAANATDGRWLVDSSIGDLAEGTNAYVGFRVAEVLDQIGQTEAIGRTPAVSGELLLAGAVLEQASIEADLTRITSDKSRRDGAIQRALETGDYPSATFMSTGRVDMHALPADGETIRVTVPGTLTIHGVAQPVEAEMSARLVDDVVAVVGSLPVDFTSFGIDMPTAPVVVSVEETGDLEWQLFFRRES